MDSARYLDDYTISRIWINTLVAIDWIWIIVYALRKEVMKSMDKNYNADSAKP